MSTLAPPRELSDTDPESVLRWAFESFSRIVLVASFQAESSVLIDMASRIRPDVRIVTLDTGRLPQETHDMIDRVRSRYGMVVEVVTPDRDEVREMVAINGTNLFYQSPDLRRLCCAVRKSRPLERALSGYDAWVTGLRRSQLATRAKTPLVAADPEHGGIAKVAPLAAWSAEQVWSYIHDHEVPYHALYDSGYTSIGCAPCTRPTRPGEDARAGRWWWEVDEVKECGLHWQKP
jgi:thioredoxin-dependent adenylylsulfate APS reductase